MRTRRSGSRHVRAPWLRAAHDPDRAPAKSVQTEIRIEMTNLNVLVHQVRQKDREEVNTRSSSVIDGMKLASLEVHFSVVFE